MSGKPTTPDGWRELLGQAVRDPELTEEQQRKGRRARRRARKTARLEQRQRSRRAIDAARRREPVTVGGAAVILVVIVAIGVGARWFSADDQDSGSPTASATPSASPTRVAPAAPASPPDSPAVSPSSSTSPDLSEPESVAKAWSTAYFTRNPVEDGDHERVVEHASPWMSRALARNLAGQNDPLWYRLVSHGGISTVAGVTVGPAKDGLPPDTPLRVWREVSIDVDVKAYTHYSDTHTVQIEVMRQDEGDWLVTRVLGL